MKFKKRGIFFSTDALMAISIIFVVLLLIFPLSSRLKPETKIHSDILNSLSTIKISEIDNSYVQSLISNGNLEVSDKSVLEQIGEFYVTDIDIARNLASSVLQDIETGENIGIWYGSTPIYLNNRTPYESAEKIDVDRKIISGLQSGEGVTGFSARAFLTNSRRNKFFYFGGYVGDGNISLLADFNGAVVSAEMEIVIDKSFEFLINGVSYGVYGASPSEFEPVRYDLPTDNLVSGENFFEFRGNQLHVSGGFVKIVYESDVVYSAPTKKFFPGVEGLVNIYEGLYVPGELNSLEVFLRLNSTQVPAFVTIGNTTIFHGTTNGEEDIYLNNLYLSTVLDYESLWGKTIPVRIGLENVSYTGIYTGVDIYSVTDISGSMSACSQYSSPLVCRHGCLVGGSKSCNVASASLCTGNACGGTCFIPYGHALDCSITQMDSAKVANNNFIDAILNHSGNRVGLQAYSSSASPSDSHSLSTNSASLKNEVNSWTESGSTCICCGINAAASSLSSAALPDKMRAMVVMSDGEANVQCAQQGTGSSSQDAIKAACDARNNHNITVHAVAFGVEAEEDTMQAIANCGGGSYYYSDVSELSEVYQEIAEHIIAQYIEQTIVSTSNLSTMLSPESYVEYSYSQSLPPSGLVFTIEETFGEETSAVLDISNDSSVIELIVASYSGPRWTDKVYINGETVFDLSIYGLPYVRLGDPHLINIPVGKVVLGQPNSIGVTTGSSPQNSTFQGGSNKIIYTLLKGANVYTGLKTSANGCRWIVDFEDGGQIEFNVPTDYSGSEVCVFNGTDSEFDLPSSGNDALQAAVFHLLSQLDIDGNGLVDVTFSQQDLQISLDEVIGIPFTWSTEVQIRRWLP